MPKLILCSCANRKLVKFPEKLSDSFKLFSEIVYVDDLCSSVLEKPEYLAGITEDSVILACHSRAVEALLDYAKAPKPKKIFDFRSGEGEGFFDYAKSLSEGDSCVSQLKESSNAWYPCIDYNLCVNCGKCEDFCIFGVYAKVDNKVTVVNPTNCKDNCPACARVCPKGAVIFPKCPDLKIAGKQEEIEEIKGDDFYDLLQKRRRRNVLK